MIDKRVLFVLISAASSISASGCDSVYEDRDGDADTYADGNSFLDSGRGDGEVCLEPDEDGDCVPDARDNCPDISNADQNDIDGDGVGDACEPRRGDLPRGYLLAQQVNTYHTSKYGAISTIEEAHDLFSSIKGKVNGVEFGSLFYSDADLKVHIEIASLATEYDIDLWGTTRRMTKRVRAFGGDPWLEDRPDFQAFLMEDDGTIVPFEVENQKVIDVLNPEAVDWLIEQYREKYVEPLRGKLTGYFMNEDSLSYPDEVRSFEGFDYWRFPVYSDAVLKRWRRYCFDNNVRVKGKLVTKFPIHEPTKVPRGEGKTEYFEGFVEVTPLIAGTRFIDLERHQGVWRHWFEFLSQSFVDGWIGRLAETFNDVNRDNPNWRGVMYFNMHGWSLSYEDIDDPSLTVSEIHRWGAWGRLKGIDLVRVATHPEIDIVICETFPPVEGGHLDDFVREHQRMVRIGGKVFGVMLHRDQGPLTREEEEARWRVIRDYEPTVLTRIPLLQMLPSHEYFDPVLEGQFLKRVESYSGSVPLEPRAYFDWGQISLRGRSHYETAKFPWGRAEHTDGHRFIGSNPPWIVLAERMGGEWDLGNPSFHVRADVPEGEGALRVRVNRDELSDEDLILLIDALTNSEMRIELWEDNGSVVARDIVVGNVLEGNGERAWRQVHVPLSSYPSASDIVLRRITGEVRIYNSLIVRQEFRTEGWTPNWIVSANSLGNSGRWDMLKSSFYVPSKAPDFDGGLRVSIDRSVFSPDENLLLTIDAEDIGHVYVQLRDSHSNRVVDNLTGGNIMKGTGIRGLKEILIPLSDHPNVSQVVIHRYRGEMCIYNSTIERIDIRN